MSFTDQVFLPFLLLVLCAVHLVRDRRAVIGILILASCIFYGWWSKAYFFLLAFVSVVDFTIGIYLGKARSPVWRKTLLGFSILSNLGLLGYFKYTGFFIGTWNGVASSALSPVTIALPLGISFFTFEALSYSIDVYRGTIVPVRKLSHFLTFISFFPHLVAGPIVRGRDFLPQLETDFVASADSSGFFHILLGLGKKLLLADLLGSWLVDPVFAHPASFGSFDLLLASYAYAFQIFLDFSGYSDIAIGIAKLIGIELRPNFDAPYLSTGFSEFWRRWHISLSTWIRDYLYLPLGGNRVSYPRLILNTLVVFLLSGLWHGAHWKFVVWGGLHGVFIVAEKAWKRWLPSLRNEGWQRILRWFIVFNGVSLAWVFFRSTGTHAACGYLSGLFRFSAPSVYTGPILAVLLAAVVSHFFERPRYAWAMFFVRLPAMVQAAVAWSLFAGIYDVSMYELGQRAFIYFQF
jgi:alginate O-acetyltransferase complex protein AlgI